MARSNLTFALVALCLAATQVLAVEDEPPSENVIVADPSNFDKTIAKSHSLVLLYAPWCGHCKAIKPAWNKVADLFADEPDVNVVSVDADAHKSLGERYEVKGFPTLKYIGPGGKAEAYEGGRSVKDFVAFLNAKAGTDVSLDGGVGKKGGLLPEVHKILAGFGAASLEDQQTKIAEAAKVVETANEEGQEKFVTYTKIAKKVMDNGVEWITKEKKRISSMIAKSKDSLTPEQRTSFQKRLNVITAFDEL